ncbi:MAG: NUDIX hydrolase [Acidimicrobiales bacterium]
MEDLDPLLVPVRPAATVMLVQDRPKLSVLMIRRAATHVFANAMWVYPGGSVDSADALGFEARCVGLDDAAASAQLGVEAGGLAYYVAAIREAFEEAGVLLGRPASGGQLDWADDATAARFEEHRVELNAGRRAFLDIVAEEHLVLDAGLLHPVGHWITPLGSPRRFDTRFFLAAMPPGQTPMHDDGEAVHHEWFEPAAAIERWLLDDMPMMSPTARMLRSLGEYAAAEEAMAAMAAGPPMQQVRVVRDDEAGVYEVLLPGDAGYAEADPEREFGFVRLWKPPAPL